MSELDSIICSGNTRAYRFMNADGKEWLVPVRNMRTGLELYQPSGAKGIALKRMLPLTHRVGAVRRVARLVGSKVRLMPELMRVAERAFGEQNLEFSVFGGTPSVHCKVTIQFFKGKRILGYAKITSSDSVTELFRHEQRVFDRLQDAGVTGVPRCLFCGNLSAGRAVFIQSTVKTLKSKALHDWLPVHDEFLTLLAQKTQVKLPFEESDIAKSLLTLRGLLPVIPEQYRNVIATNLEQEYESRLGTEQTLCAFHADFTPWNMLVQDRRLFVFDWEYAQFSYPPFLDRYHFFVQQAIHVSHLSADEVYSKLSSYAWFDRSDLRIYILDIISRFVSRENGEFPESLHKSMTMWIQLLQKQ